MTQKENKHPQSFANLCDTHLIDSLFSKFETFQNQTKLLTQNIKNETYELRAIVKKFEKTKPELIHEHRHLMCFYIKYSSSIYC